MLPILKSLRLHFKFVLDSYSKFCSWILWLLAAFKKCYTTACGWIKGISSGVFIQYRPQEVVKSIM